MKKAAILFLIVAAFASCKKSCDTVSVSFANATANPCEVSINGNLSFTLAAGEVRVRTMPAKLTKIEGEFSNPFAHNDYVTTKDFTDCDATHSVILTD